MSSSLFPGGAAKEDKSVAGTLLHDNPISDLAGIHLTKEAARIIELECQGFLSTQPWAKQSDDDLTIFHKNAIILLGTLVVYGHFKDKTQAYWTAVSKATTFDVKTCQKVAKILLRDRTPTAEKVALSTAAPPAAAPASSRLGPMSQLICKLIDEHVKQTRFGGAYTGSPARELYIERTEEVWVHQTLRNGSPNYDPIDVFLRADTLEIFHVEDPSVKDWFRYRTNNKRRGPKRDRSASPETRVKLPNERSRSPLRSGSGSSTPHPAYPHSTGGNPMSPAPSSSPNPVVSESAVTAHSDDLVSDMPTTPRSAIKHDAGMDAPSAASSGPDEFHSVFTTQSDEIAPDSASSPRLPALPRSTDDGFIADSHASSDGPELFHSAMTTQCITDDTVPDMGSSPPRAAQGIGSSGSPQTITQSDDDVRNTLGIAKSSDRNDRTILENSSSELDIPAVVDRAGYNHQSLTEDVAVDAEAPGATKDAQLDHDTAKGLDENSFLKRLLFATMEETTTGTLTTLNAFYGMDMSVEQREKLTATLGSYQVALENLRELKDGSCMKHD